MANYTNTVWDRQGNIVSQVTLPIPITIENRDTLETKAQAALAANATFLAIANPTAAQVAAQSKALTRQVNALIRLVLDRFDSTSDT